ncbi:MAG TPA: DCC1-like thiol-disulfide oxidoreductase family protein [Solirubrobacteraceae bacterium]|nr:DCC1-like thiol-disulfide oxidoreductase family protein [Solirubrobacteraceae bacterium]
MPAAGDHALLYDADCGLCRTVVGVLLWLDRGRRLRAVALQSPEAGELLPAMGADERMASVHVVGPGGSVYSGGAALAALASLLPGGRPAASALAALPAVADRAYALVAGNRGRLGELVPRRLRSWADCQIARRA